LALLACSANSRSASAAAPAARPDLSKVHSNRSRGMACRTGTLCIPALAKALYTAPHYAQLWQGSHKPAVRSYWLKHSHPVASAQLWKSIVADAWPSCLYQQTLWVDITADGMPAGAGLSM
jgi:hypothetical protein